VAISAQLCYIVPLKSMVLITKVDTNEKVEIITCSKMRNSRKIIQRKRKQRKAQKTSR